VVSSKVFNALDSYVWTLTYKWAKHSHPNKPKRWIVNRYFGQFNPTRQAKWVFGDRDSGAYLRKLAWTKIIRHQLVGGTSSPDDPSLTDYWATRRRRGPAPVDRSTLRLLRTQNGRCPLCGDYLLHAEREPQSPQEWEQWLRVTRRATVKQHIVIRNGRGTPDEPQPRLLHAHCHRRHTAAPGNRPASATARDPSGLARAGCGETRPSGSEGAPAQQCAGATRQHEVAYLALRHTLLHGRVLRSGDPAGLEQEIWALLALYQALRRAMVTAVESVPGTDPDRASFTTALQTTIDTLTAADGVITDDPSGHGQTGRAVLATLLPPRRPRVSVRKVKSPLSRWNKADPHRPARSTPITALTITVSGPDTTPQSATRRDRCLTTAPGP
jgi:Group II intron, maturase-specific domain